MSEFNLREMADILDVCSKAFYPYIRDGKLKARRMEAYITSPYVVTAHDFAIFLCETPHLRTRFTQYLKSAKEEKMVSVKLREVAEYMRENHIRYLYSVTELAKHFNVTRNTVLYWTKKGYLKADVGERLYSKNAIQKLVKAYPKVYKYIQKDSA